MVEFRFSEFSLRLFGPARSLFSLTVIAFLVFGSANSRIEHVPGLHVRRIPAVVSNEFSRRSVLRLRGSGDDDTSAEASRLKELGNQAYKDKKFAEALEHYEKVYKC